MTCKCKHCLVPFIKLKRKTVTEVARYVKVDRATLYKWDKGWSYPTIDKVVDIANCLNTDVLSVIVLFMEG